MVAPFVKRLNQEIHKRIASGFLDEEYFTTCKHNRNSVVHARMQALIVFVCYQLGYDVEIERSFHYRLSDRNLRFRPDVCVYKNNELLAFIEYESTNSSDARFYDMERKTSDLRCLKYYASDLSNTIPQHWIIISTLPRNPVEYKTWKSHDYGKRSTEFKKLITSPFAFYYSTYLEETSRLVDDVHTNVHLLNLDGQDVSVEFQIHYSSQSK